MDLGIAGKTALVCASSRGLGRGCALALAREGAAVTIVSRTREAIEATARDISHRVSTIPWSTSGRAVSLGETDGLTKLVLEPGSNLVLGLGIVGAGAAEMIGEAALAIEMGAVAEDLAAVLHPHPSLGELISEAARQAD